LELGELIRSVVRGHESIALQKKVSLEVAAAEPIFVQGEKSLLERLISNLLENAIKYTPSEGSVTLETVRRTGQSVLIVKDTGKGILAEDLPKVFDKFFSHQHSANGIPSTGIGLGLCRWIAEVHKGKIKIVSAPGQGAEFTILFPASGV